MADTRQPPAAWRRMLLTGGLLAAGLVLCILVERFEWLDPYLQLVLVYLGINIMLAASLNLVNGYMGEFSIGHAGFMAVGAYGASVLTVQVLPPTWPTPLAFPLAVAAGGAAAALAGFVVAIPSFRTRGDYLAIVTLAFGMIVKSVLENVEAVGGPRGYMGMERLTSLPWVFAWTAATILVLRNLVYSKYGRGMAAIRDDELAGTLSTVRTRRVKIVAFVVSAGCAGAAGGLYAHALQFINPRMFDILKSTDMLVMVYLGGAASLGGSILGAAIFTVLMELLRPLGVWRMVLMPLLLVLLMLFRPRGIMGGREFRWLVPLRDRLRPTPIGKEAAPHAPS
jgi:branched-chain amino acid transport system permease protein